MLQAFRTVGETQVRKLQIKVQRENPQNTEPQQNATNKRKYTPTWKPRERKQLHRTNQEHINNLWTYPVAGHMIHDQKTWTSPYVHILYCTRSTNKETYSGLTHTGRAGALSTSKPKPLSILPINTSRVISYNTITMTFVTTSNCNISDNMCKKTCKRLGSQNEHSDLQTNIVLIWCLSDRAS